MGTKRDPATCLRCLPVHMTVVADATPGDACTVPQTRNQAVQGKAAQP
jgi:hypothetical protein